jgi:2-desacetyl-2-hydroxyethyl bacteriochlorophyllide A dehydrogenase
MNKAYAVAFTANDQVELTSFELPDLQAGEVLIRTEVSGVSPGTEMRCLAGMQPESVAYPYVPGYSMAGVVEAVASGSHIAVGDRVFASGTKRASINLQWGGHVSHAIASEDSVYPIPTGCPSKLASLSKLAAIALRGVRVSRSSSSDHVAVVGLGPIGMLSARLHRAAGAQVLGLDQEISRVNLAKASGIDAAVVKGTILETVQEHFGQGADIVVDATGNPKVLPFSLAAVRDLAWGITEINGPKLVIQGSYPDQFSLPYQDAFRKELTILLPRDGSPAEIRDILSMIANGACQVEDLISWYGDPSDAHQAYGRLRSDRTSMTVAFDWSAYS